jgi:hypothetical protein
MSLKELFASTVTEPGRYTVNYIKDGWLRFVEFTVKTPTQLAYLWSCYSEKNLVNINSVTQIDRN